MNSGEPRADRSRSALLRFRRMIAFFLAIQQGYRYDTKTIAGKITEKQLEEIAKLKMPDLNCFSVESAMNSVRGTARSMGVDVV